MPAEIKPSSPEDVVAGQVPVWMNASFFQKALKEGGEDPKIRVMECDVTEALGKGENYVSIVYRAVAKEEGGKKHHLIVKCLPSNEARKVMSKKAQFFRKEIDMYEVVFPAYQEIRGTADTSLPWPKLYFSVFNGDRDYLVMEDLREAGYVMRERLKGFDRNHLEAALSALAKYHAYSYALKLRDPEGFKRKVLELFPETMFTEELKDMMGVYLKSSYELTAAEVRGWGGPRYEMIATKMEEMVGTAYDEMCSLMVPVEPGAVLTHGDFWVNNMLFKYSSKEEAETGSGKPVDVKLLDFQIARYSSPACDLTYLMVTSTTAKTRREHWDDLLVHTYLASFWNTLESLGHKDEVEEGVFTWEWLKAEIKRFQPFAFMSSVTVTQAVLAEVEKAPDMDALTEDDLTSPAASPFAELAKGKIYAARFCDLLDDFEDWGYLNWTEP